MRHTVYGVFQSQRALHVISLTHTIDFAPLTQSYIEGVLQKYADDLAITAANVAAPHDGSGKRAPLNREVTNDMLLSAWRIEGLSKIFEGEVLSRYDRELGLQQTLTAAVVATYPR